MTVPTRVVNFDITQFTGLEYATGDAVLVLRPIAPSVVGTDVVPASPVSIIPNAAGEGTVNLVPGVLGTPPIDYNCTILVYRTQFGNRTFAEHDFGTFRVPETSGPFNLAELIGASIPPQAETFWSAITEVEYNAAIAAANTAQNAANTATAAADRSTGYTTRAAFVTANNANPGLGLSNGHVVTAAGYQYIRQTGANILPSLSGWVPSGQWDYRHFGAVGDGSTNDQPAMQAALTQSIAAARTIRRSAGNYFMASNALGANAAIEIVDPGAVTSGPGGVFNVVRIEQTQGGIERRSRTGGIVSNETVGAFEEYRSTASGGNYGHRINYWQQSPQTGGFSIGHGVIADFGGCNGPSSQGLAVWLVAQTPTSQTARFGVFGAEVNPVNVSADEGYSRRRGNLERWTGGIQVAPEGNGLTVNLPGAGRNTTYGFAVCQSGAQNDIGKHVKTYNGFLAEENSIAPGGRAFLASGTPTATDRPAIGLQIDVHWDSGIDTQEAVFGTGRALTMASGQAVQWGTTGTPAVLTGNSATGRVNIASGGLSVAGNPVVGTRVTGWGAPTGTATRTTFDTSTVTLPQLAERVKALIDDLTAHGMIGA